MRPLDIFLGVALLLICCCEHKKKMETDRTKKVDSASISQERNDNSTRIGRIIEDTMVMDDRSRLLESPDSRGKEIISLDRCTVFVLDKNPVPNVRTTNVVDTFVKVRTVNNDTGYLWREVLSTKSQLKAHNDSLSMWTKSPMPQYKNLIGTTYYKNSELPIELGSGAFISVGEDNRFGIISVYNKYTDNYSYLFFVVDSGRNAEGDNGLLILDIIRLDWRQYGAEASLKMRQCECAGAGEDCSEVVAVYAHSEEMAKKGILITPEKAWKPDYTKKKLVEIPAKSVKCGSHAPEEYDEEEFPG